MRFFKNFRVLFLFFLTLIFLLKETSGNAFMVTAHHNAKFELAVFIHHAPSDSWVQQYFDQQSAPLIQQVQFLGLYQHKNRIFYLVYYFNNRALKLLFHPVEMLRENDQERGANITLQSIDIPFSARGVDEFLPYRQKIDVYAVFSAFNSDKDHVFVYGRDFIKYCNLKTPDQWWNVMLGYDTDEVAPDSKIETVGIHGNNAYYIKRKDRNTTFLYEGILYQSPEDALGLDDPYHYFPKMNNVLFDGADDVYSQPQILFFDRQKSRYLALGPMMTPKSGTAAEIIPAGSIGGSYASDKIGYWALNDYSIPYASFLNKDRKEYGFLSVDTGYVGMFTDENTNKAELYSVLDGETNRYPLEKNLPDKRSKLLLGSGEQRYIAVNNGAVHMSLDGKQWKHRGGLPLSDSFQDVIWVRGNKK